MTDQKKLFADLEALTEEQIELGLAAGVWAEEVRPLVQHYVHKRKLTRVEAAAKQLNAVREAARLAVVEARRAQLKASAALIIAGGAMLAAIPGALLNGTD